MSHNKSYNMPARTSLGKAQKRSAIVAQHPAAGEKFGRCALRSLRVGSSNVDLLNRRCEEVLEMVSRRHLDICCLQETRWSADGARVFGDNKLFWVSSRKGQAGVGVVVAERWVNEVVEVKRICDKDDGDKIKDRQGLS